MLSYFWVALGGAVGSMARLWLGVHVAMLTGLAFPWGTHPGQHPRLAGDRCRDVDRPWRTRGGSR
jgi:hypothetical protein